MQIAFELPNDFVALQSVDQVRQEVQFSYAVWLYQHGRVTLAKAAELAGLDLYDFMGLCKSNRVPVIHMTRDELLEEINGMSAT